MTSSVQTRSTLARVLFVHAVSRLGDERVEAGDERAVTVGFVDPAASFGVGGEGLGVDALGGEDSAGGLESVRKLGQCSQMLA